MPDYIVSTITDAPEITIFACHEVTAYDKFEATAKATCIAVREAHYDGVECDESHIIVKEVKSIPKLQTLDEIKREIEFWNEDNFWPDED